MDLGRHGPRWYVLQDEHVRGGPFPSRENAEAEVERRYEEMSEYYDAVEDAARRDGYTVCW